MVSKSFLQKPGSELVLYNRCVSGSKYVTDTVSKFRLQKPGSELVLYNRCVFSSKHFTAVVSKSLLQKPGSELVLYNSFMSESDLPKVCYAQKHKKEGPSKVDYFSCKQCNFKCKYHSDKQFSCLKVKTQNPADSERN